MGVRIPPGAPQIELRLRHQPLTDDERYAAVEVLSSAERTRYRELDDIRATAYLAGRALLREVAGALLGVGPAEVPLVARCNECGREHGRPVLVGTDLRVSLTHAGSTVGVAAHWDHAVGIDAEPIDGSPERLAAIKELTGVPSLRHWTRVEAVLKADGRGLRVDPGNVRIVEDADGVSATVEGESQRYRLVDVPTDAGIVVTVAVAE